MAAPETATGPVNLGNPVEFTIRELAEAVLAQTGSSSKLVFKPLHLPTDGAGGNSQGFCSPLDRATHRDFAKVPNSRGFNHVFGAQSSG